MKTLYLDCFSGASGNMLLGCLLDLGVPADKLRQAVADMRLDGCGLVLSTVQRSGIQALHVEVALTEKPHRQEASDASHPHPHEHGHEHGHHHHHDKEQPISLDALPHLVHGHGHHHVGLSDLVARVQSMPFSAPIKARSCAVLQRLGEAEARVHGKPVDEVHFHEVGALDTLVDIVGTVLCLDWLGIERIVAAPIATGFGFVRCAHGLMPVPAPATQALLTGIPHRRGQIEGELLTPTGAALLAELVDEWGDVPADFHQTAVGYGAGSRELAIPNVLRGLLGTQGEDSAPLCVLETNIDDLNPQFYAHAMEQLFAAGALDVWLTPIQMKKGRPAHLVSALLHRDLVTQAADILFAETSTIGVRHYPVARIIADREIISVESPWGPVHVKIASRAGKVVQVMPEYDDCCRLAATHNLALKTIWQCTLQLALEKVSHERS